MAALPVWSYDDIAAYLTDGYWSDNFSAGRSFDIAVGGTISVNIVGFSDTGLFEGEIDANGLAADAMIYARAALAAWSEATGINFVETAGAADIYFGDEYSGAYSWSWTGGGSISRSFVNISSTWGTDVDGALDSYWFQTYMHEIGHALGLGHGGNYNGSGDYLTDADYANDSWQASLMSYFSQSENTYINGTFAYTLTPMVADIIAIRALYGLTGTTRTGATVYGYNSNAGGAIQDFVNYGNSVSMTIIDDGGIDTFDFSGYSGAQMIDLRQEMFSNVLGEIGTVGIARGTVIENAIGGGGGDLMIGNSANNRLAGQGGADVIYAGAGEDHIFGGDGVDELYGELGADYIEGNVGNDIIYGGGGHDELHGGNDDDTIYGGSGRDSIYGEGGNDTLYGGGGRDYIHGGAGVDELHGGAMNDRLVGGGGGDTLYGDDGNDKLDGQAGNDHYWGGGGADDFIFNATHFATDTIHDFAVGVDEMIIRHGTIGATSIVQDGDDMIVTIGNEVIIVVDGWLNGFSASDIVFV